MFAMRIRNASAYFIALGVSATLVISGCAAASSAESAASAGAAGESTPPAASAASASASASMSAPVSAPASSGVAGTQSSIPSAPGTAGSAALPPTAAVAPVTSGPGEVATPLPNCTPSTLKTRTPGRLVFTAAGSASAPWFNGAPSGGKGYEAAVALAVAKELGYSASSVSWSTTARATLLAGKASGFDVAIGEFATPDVGSSTVDYSSGYFSISNSVVSKTGRPAAAITSSAGLKGMAIGVVAGAPAVASARTGATVRTYPNATAALAALTGGTVSAVVVPTPTAVTLGAAFTVVGQLPDGDEQPQQFGMVLPKHSPLTSCVSAAVDQLRVTGVLSSLVRTWVPDAAKPLG
ncbi:polar amino acid transport system substrate-binding protein [Nakamurella panacisegetis]|uniref:Polar amino acid transport system substrate-binding protein n=1 Tax=Nakamurella panacisegetis TaxID=1090615 RepID=A0A1H0T4B6_9ACTN|nr:transporter substrate-binding domain-containing protein [Nakamurella panacisegetis]SDP48809.1 polar amino acid transport system substrate-binding protein [Nakamurella panacisegetis]